MKRETTITIGGKSIPVDYDNLIQDVDMLSLNSLEAAVEIVCDDFYWLVALPWLNESDARKNTFMVHFQERKKERMNALKGDKLVSHGDELDFLCHAKDYMDSGIENAQTERLIGLRFMEFLKEGHVPFSKMAKMLKDGGVNSGRGGLTTKRGKLLQAFCMLAHGERRLPRRREILDHLRIHDADQRKEARDDLKYLGFKGLDA